MSIVEYELLFKDAKCSLIYLGHQTRPSCITDDFIKTIKENAKLCEAACSTCGEKSEYLANKMGDLGLVQNPGKLVMIDWLCSIQPQTKYRSWGLTTGASYHALAYFEKDSLFFACDLNLCPDDIRTPFLQIFVSENQEDLLKLLNAVYANKSIYLLDTTTPWYAIYSEKKDSKLMEFKTLHRLEDIQQKTAGAETSLLKTRGLFSRVGGLLDTKGLTGVGAVDAPSLSP